MKKTKSMLWLTAVGLMWNTASPAAIPANLTSVGNQITEQASGSVLNRSTGTFDSVLTLTNTGKTLYGSITLAVTGLPANVTLANASGDDGNGNPTLRVMLTQSGWAPGQTLAGVNLKFSNPAHIKFGFTANVYGTAIQPVAATTYHYDNSRSGWNSHETLLTPASVADAAHFGMRSSVTLDDQVDAQPLVVPNVQISAGNYAGIHDVVYVATGSNTVYAIDASSGQVLLSQNFGAPVPYPIGCNNNGPNVGITGTPVIDPATNLLYMIAYTNEANGPVYRIHALDIGNLTDKLAPVVVSASHTLSDGGTFSFNALLQRQRPALILANGNIYAGFGSFCDLGNNLSRGWVLGWSADTLTPLAANNLTNALASQQNQSALSSVWMSGNGISADESGSLYFVTGNSAMPYDGVNNIQESAVKLSSDLTALLDIFTPADMAILDENDLDFGSGGILLLPPQPGNAPNLSVAAGKMGVMYLMDNNNLGGFAGGNGADNVLGAYQIGSCFCGEIYFNDVNGVTHVVSSGGLTANSWKVLTSATSQPQLAFESASQIIGDGTNSGFFTSISSAGGASPIVWAVSRPQYITSPVMLYALDATNNLQTLFSASAGTWPYMGGSNSNIVPVTANGKVYVASYKQLAIFGLQ
ncbi:MAG: hypothetical protein ABSB19_12335 [Methylomonas sp.]